MRLAVSQTPSNTPSNTPTITPSNTSCPTFEWYTNIKLFECQPPLNELPLTGWTVEHSGISYTNVQYWTGPTSASWCNIPVQDPFIGASYIFELTTLPSGWSICDGSSFPFNVYWDSFEVVLTGYNGRTCFTPSECYQQYSGYIDYKLGGVSQHIEPDVFEFFEYETSQTENCPPVYAMNNQVMMFIVDVTGPTPTPSITPSNTTTPSNTPSNTATQTPTGTQSATSTPTGTPTQTPTTTTTLTSTPTTTPTASCGCLGYSVNPPTVSGERIAVEYVDCYGIDQFIEIYWTSTSQGICALSYNVIDYGINGSVTPFPSNCCGDYPPPSPTATSTSTPSPTPTSSTGATLYCRVGIWEVDDPLHPSGGTVNYIDQFGNPQTITGVWLDEYIQFYAIQITFITGLATTECISPTPSATPTLTPTNTATQTSTPTGTIVSTPTMTSTPTESPSICQQQVYISAQVSTCSDLCTINYNIGTPQSAENVYAGLTIGDFLCGLGGGYYAYSDVSTDTQTGPFRIADVDGTGEILGIYVCSGGSCVPL
jgi:hypothetical protein